MERLTSTSSIGGLAFNFDLEVTCDRSEIDKILKIGARLKEYEDTNLTPDQFKKLDKLYWEKCEEINQLKENQTPKKPISKTFGYAGEVPYTKFMCPTGCCKIAIHKERDNYCPNCGVKIDWSVEK